MVYRISGIHYCKMAPIQVKQPEDIESKLDKTINQLVKTKLLDIKAENGVDDGKVPDWSDKLPESTRRRFEKYGIDLSGGYPVNPPIETIPKYLDEAFAVRNEEYPYIERGKNADPEKKALFGAAEKVINLTKHIGTEIVGLQLSELSDKQRDELALLIAERVVVFFRDQDLSPQKHLELGRYFGQIENHPLFPRVPNAKDGEDLNGISTIWQDYLIKAFGLPVSFKRAQYYGNSRWHTDLVHEFQPAGITHLHLDSIPEVGGDTLWSSG